MLKLQRDSSFTPPESQNCHVGRASPKACTYKSHSAEAFDSRASASQAPNPDLYAIMGDHGALRACPNRALSDPGAPGARSNPVIGAIPGLTGHSGHVQSNPAQTLLAGTAIWKANNGHV